MARPQKISDEAILSAARELFVQSGPQASCDRLAEQLGVSSAALFKRFGTKQNLLQKALTPEVPSWIGHLFDGPDPEAPVREQLTAMATRLLRFFRVALPCMLALRTHNALQVPEHAGRPAPVVLQQGLSTFVAAAQAAHRLGPGDPLAIAQALIGGVQARVMLEHLGGTPARDDNELIKNLIDVLYSGIAPEAEASQS